MIGNRLPANSLIMKIITRLMGTLSLHMQLRLGTVYQYLNKQEFEKGSLINVLDLGCGGGINVLELQKLVLKKKNQFVYSGVDITVDKTKNLDIWNAKFYKQDCLKYLEDTQETYNIIFLLDILEHIPYPKQVVNLCKDKLKDGGMILVSVPTPNYPKVFGRKWHEDIGHLVDGYTLDQLNDTVDLKPIYYKYHTGIFSKYGCWLEYNKLMFKNNKLNLIKQLTLYWFKYLDWFNNEKVSCSLFTVYKKPPV